VHASPRTRRTLSTAEFRPPRALGVIVGGGFTAWGLIAALIAFRVAFGAEAEFKSFLAWAVGAVCLALGLLFANWTWSLFSLTYRIEAEALTIRWGFRTVTIPISGIQRMVPGRTLDEAHVQGLNWWGCHVGTADVKRIGLAMFYSTHSSPDELLYLVTTGEAYALTVLDQAGFAEEIQARAAVAPLDDRPHRASATGIVALPLWRDRASLLALGLSALGCLVVAAYVFARYPGLPNVVEINFPAIEDVVRVGDKGELLRIAYLAAGIFVANGVLGLVLHARERAAGTWVLAGSGLLQLVLLTAAVLAFGQA